MIWLAWRQHRRQLLFALIGLAVLAAALVPTGLDMRDTFASSGLRSCLAKLGNAEFVSMSAAESCDRLSSVYQARYSNRILVAVLLTFLPLLVGLFWGAPLVARELEQHTHRLVWTQGVSRLRWLAVKVGLVGTVAVLVAAAFTALTTWWLEPLTRTVTVPMEFLVFDLRGAAPLGYTLFAVAVGVCAGTVLRRVLPAMAATLVAFLAVRVAVAGLVRPELAEPLTRRQPTAGQSLLMPNPAVRDLLVETGIHAADGRLLFPDATALCQGDGAGPPPCGGPGAYNQWVYQPADRFWWFQWWETGLYAALTAGLLGATVYLVRRRVS